MTNPVWRYASVLLLVLSVMGLGAGLWLETNWVPWGCATMLAYILLRLETLIIRTQMFDEDDDD